jgi:NAD(P)-dependent dehydrogenase (short-subunit alcohol dehydrogenase family)
MTLKLRLPACGGSELRHTIYNPLKLIENTLSIDPVAILCPVQFQTPSEILRHEGTIRNRLRVLPYPATGPAPAGARGRRGQANMTDTRPTGSPRSILITGCSSGIGRHAALGLKAHGWRVFAGVRSRNDLASLAEEGVEPVHLDYDSPAIVATALYRVLDLTNGRLDALFNNGAFGQLGAVEDIATEHLRAQFEANFFGWHELIRKVVPVMRRQGGGRIVNCSSILGFVAARYRGAYVASKYALEGMTDALRLELAGTGIHVVLIEPGPIRSRFVDNALARFNETVDSNRSVHRDAYAKVLARLKRGDASSRFKRGPEAVFTKLVHALEADSPRARYRVTAPTHVAAWMKRLLPTGLIDRIVLSQH